MDFESAVTRALELIPKEVARDGEITAHAMTIINLRQAREKLAKDMTDKEALCAGLNNKTPDELKSAVDAYTSTLEDEKKIVGDIRINEARQSITARIMRGNLEKKKVALEAFSRYRGGK